MITPNTPYPPGAYDLVGAATDYTLRQLSERRHVSAAELVKGLHDYARQEYGVMAGTVLKGLGLNSPKDVGRIVFDLIAAGKLSASESDQESDFNISWPAEEKAPVHHRKLVAPRLD